MRKYNTEYKEWIEDGNVIQFKEGYATQDAQYSNRLTEEELYKYFVREFYRN